MEANELRPNNFLYDLELGNMVVYVPDKDKGENYHPIQITIDWIPKLGFKKCEERINGGREKWSIRVSDLEYLVCEDGEFFISDSRGNRVFTFWYDVEYIHQLQNLYYSLTNEELLLTEWKLLDEYLPDEGDKIKLLESNGNIIEIDELIYIGYKPGVGHQFFTVDDKNDPIYFLDITHWALRYNN